MQIETAILHIANNIRKKYKHGKNIGKCLEASNKIVKSLQKLKIPAYEHIGFYKPKNSKRWERHSWVVISVSKTDVKYLDVTADQFGESEPSIIFDSPENLRQYK